jgi:hypothetical protein
MTTDRSILVIRGNPCESVAAWSRIYALAVAARAFCASGAAGLGASAGFA